MVPSPVFSYIFSPAVAPLPTPRKIFTSVPHGRGRNATASEAVPSYNPFPTGAAAVAVDKFAAWEVTALGAAVVSADKKTLRASPIFSDAVASAAAASRVNAILVNGVSSSVAGVAVIKVSLPRENAANEVLK